MATSCHSAAGRNICADCARGSGEHKASVVVLDAYTGRNVVELLRPDEELKDDWSCSRLFSDPAMGGIVTLKA